MRPMTNDGGADRRTSILAWALVAAAAVHVAIWGIVNWYRVFGPYLILRLEDLSSIVTGVAPFLLAAAVLAAAARWPAGRRWLYAGAALWAIHGVVRTAMDAWWAWRFTDPVAPEGALAISFVVANLVGLTAAALAPLGLALGLRRAQPARVVPPLLTALAIAIGLLAAAANLGPLGRELAFASGLGLTEAAYVALAIVQRSLMAIGAVGLVLLAHAAVRSVPASGSVVATLIATGATLAAAGMAATSAAQSLVPLEAQSEHLLWVFTIPWTVESLGRVVLIAGFAVAALLVAPARPSSSDDRRPPTETMPG